MKSGRLNPMRDDIEIRSGMVFETNWPFRKPDRIVVIEMFGPSLGNVFSLNQERVYMTDVRVMMETPYTHMVDHLPNLPNPWFLKGDIVTLTGDPDQMVVMRDMSFVRSVVVRDIAQREFTFPSDKLTLVGKTPTKTPSIYKDPESGSSFFVLDVNYDNWTVKAFDNDHDNVVMFSLDAFAALNLELHYY